jgi:hypothetical protein
MARERIEIVVHRRVFQVRGTAKFPDRKHISQGDLVEVRLRCNVVKQTPELANDGKWDLVSLLDAVEGRVVRLDKQQPAKPRRKTPR